MESWLLDVKKMKIPRPKFSGKYPMEPPKDYYDDQNKEDKRTAAAFLTSRNIVKATEDLRRELQDKL